MGHNSGIISSEILAKFSVPQINSTALMMDDPLGNNKSALSHFRAAIEVAVSIERFLFTLEVSDLEQQKLKRYKILQEVSFSMFALKDDEKLGNWVDSAASTITRMRLGVLREAWISAASLQFSGRIWNIATLVTHEGLINIIAAAIDFDGDYVDELDR